MLKSGKKWDLIGYCGMEFLGTLDDKCRISLPTRLRGSLSENKLILTKGFNKSIWVYEPKEWENVCKDLLASFKLSINRQLIIQHQFIAPRAEMEIDKAGRIAIPQSLRDYASLSKDIKILDVVNRLEIWDSGQYSEYQKENEAKLQEVLEEMGPVTLFSGNPDQWK
jgi:MraZ protein